MRAPEARRALKLSSMTTTATFAALSLFLVSFAQVGCSQDEAAPAPEPEDRQTISGRLETEGGGGGIGTRTVGAGDTHLHVVAHRLGNKGAHDRSLDVDASVAADGSFDLHLSRGARYVFELERGAESVAFFGWRTADAAAKTTVLGISAATKGRAAVSMGLVKVVGNGAVPETSLTTTFDQNDTTGIDLTANWFVSARGALLVADEALEEAKAAIDEAQKVIEDAKKQIEDAKGDIEDAKKQIEDAKKAMAGAEE